MATILFLLFVVAMLFFGVFAREIAVVFARECPAVPRGNFRVQFSRCDDPVVSSMQVGVGVGFMIWNPNFGVKHV